MQFSFLFILLSILSISYGQTPSASLQTNYCQLLNLSTPELVLQINSDTASRNRSTQTIVRTQHFEVNGSTVSLAYIKDKSNLKIEQTGQNLISSLYTQNVANDLIYIDSRDQYMIALEVIDPQNSVFNYALLKADLGNSMTLVKSTISSSNAGQLSISNLNLKKIVEISNNFMYLIMQGTQRTSLFKVDLSNPSNMIFVSDISSTGSLNIVSGNKNHLYDASTMRFYELSGSVGSEIYTPTMLNQLGIDNIMNLNTLKFTELGSLVLLSSTLGQDTIIIPIDSSAITPARAIKIKGTSPVKIYTDKWKNFLAVTDQDFVWIRSTDQGMVYNIFSLTLPIQQRDTLQAIFSNAQYISFDQSYALVLSKNVGQSVGSLTSVLYDPTKAPYFTISDSLNNALDLNSSNFTSLANPTGSGNFLSSFRCNCVSLEVQRFECYAGALKCITVTKSTRVDCTKSA